MASANGHLQKKDTFIVVIALAGLRRICINDILLLSRRGREAGTAAHVQERLSSTGIKDTDFRSEVAVHALVDRGDVMVDKMNRLLMIILQKLDEQFRTAS
jgi:hypothetical protein